MSLPSARALEVAKLAHSRKGAHKPDSEQAVIAVEAAHNPALGLDRSVCLRDVVDALRVYDPASGALTDVDAIGRLEDFGAEDAANFLEREFTK